jgi:hypothetical protein
MRLRYIQKNQRELSLFLSRHAKQFLDIMPNERRRINLSRYVKYLSENKTTII